MVIQAALKRSRRLWAYTQREDLNMRMPNFAVSTQPYLWNAESAEPPHPRCCSVLWPQGKGKFGCSGQGQYNMVIYLYKNNNSADQHVTETSAI